MAPLAAIATAQPDRRAVVTVRSGVTAPGTYSVSIVVGGPSTVSNRVRLLIGSLARTAVTGRDHPRAHMSVRLKIAGQTLTVSAVGRSAKPTLAVRVRLLSVTPVASTVAGGTTAATTATRTPPPSPPPPSLPPPPPPPPASGPPGPGSPYTTLIWSDDFVADWAREGGTGTATEPVPSSWSIDHYGGCGSSISTYPGTAATAFLSSQGLVLPAIQTGPNQYVTGQVDTGPISGESWQYGAIEASIQLPAGQGLCPAFWMLANDGHSGELDVLEAPSFVGSQWTAFAPYPIFTLHANNTQVWEAHAQPSGWVQGQPNVYGVFWTPSTITWTVNYVPYATASASSLANPAQWSAFTSAAYHLILDEAVGGWPGTPPTGTAYTQPMIVQWVKVYH